MDASDDLQRVSCLAFGFCRVLSFLSALLSLFMYANSLVIESGWLGGVILFVFLKVDVLLIRMSC